jgi:hypothetical protein
MSDNVETERTEDQAEAEIAKLREEVARLTSERDKWAEKWSAMRRKYAELRWPGMKRRVVATRAQQRADEALTPQQEAVFEFVGEFSAVNGAPPTCREIADAFGWRSENAAWEKIQALLRKGLLVQTDGKVRSLRQSSAA